MSRDVQLAKAQEKIAFWTSKKGKALAKANIQAKEAANQASLLAIKEMEAADAAQYFLTLLRVLQKALTK